MDAPPIANHQSAAHAVAPASPFGEPYSFANPSPAREPRTESDDLRVRFELIAAGPNRTPETMGLLSEIRHALEAGTLRVAEPKPEGWVVHTWVKRAILLHTALGRAEIQTDPLPGVELDTLPWRTAPITQCRIPSGSLIREGAYLGPDVTCMPPAVVQIGAFVDERSVIDSFALVGLCAQLGRGVHVGSGSIIGGYIMPLENTPTILEDDVILGGTCGVYEGVRIGRGAVLMAGTTITPFNRVFDLRTGEWLGATDNQPLSIPPFSIVAMGARSLGDRATGLQMNVPIIVGTRKGEDAKSFEFVHDLTPQESEGGKQ